MAILSSIIPKPIDYVLNLVVLNCFRCSVLLVFIYFCFLLFRISWAGRRSGSDSESDEEHPQQVSSEFCPPNLNYPPNSAAQFQNNLAARKLANVAAGSPQLSGAEFLQDE